MRLALNQARMAYEQNEVPVGAVIVQNEQVIGEGHNMRETLQDPTAHAEMIAITQAAETLGSWRLIDCTLYVTLEPCPICAGALVQARIPLVLRPVQPDGVLDVVPKHSEVPGQAIRLQLELLEQPALCGRAGC